MGGGCLIINRLIEPAILVRPYFVFSLFGSWSPEMRAQDAGRGVGRESPGERWLGRSRKHARVALTKRDAWWKSSEGSTTWLSNRMGLRILRAGIS